MANNLSASFPAYWSRRMQRKYYKDKVYSALASMEERATLKKGNTVHRPYRSELAVNTLSSEGAYTRQDITDTDESLVINIEREVSFYVRDIDDMQSNYNTINDYADDAGNALGDKIDGDYLGEYDQATSKVGNYDLGGGGSLNDGIGFTLSPSNILQVFGKIRKKMDALNINQANRWGVISPEFFDILWQFIAGKESQLGDATGQNGMIGSWGGFRLHKSNNEGWSGKLLIGSVPTAGDTVVINGVTFTFVDTGNVDTAGEVYYGLNAAAAITNLVAAVNAPGTASAGVYSPVSAADQKKLKDIAATGVSGGITFKATGKSYVAVSETLTAVADIWTTTLQIQHQLFGQDKAIDLVIQKYPSMLTKERDGYIGKDIVSYVVYGKKTFSEDAKKLVDVLTRSDAY